MDGGQDGIAQDEADAVAALLAAASGDVAEEAAHSSGEPPHP